MKGGDGAPCAWGPAERGAGPQAREPAPWGVGQDTVGSDSLGESVS